MLYEVITLAKTDLPAMAQVMRNSLQIAKALALLIEPVMPERAEKLWTQLGMTIPLAEVGFDEVLVDLMPGQLAHVITSYSIHYTKLYD